MRKILFIFGGILALVVSGLGGMHYSKNHFVASYEGAMTNLRFSDLKTLYRIKLDLINGCEKQALSRLSHAMDEKKMLMAEYIQSTEDPVLQVYITKRDPELWEELKSYQVDWSKTWEISGCEKAKTGGRKK